MKEIKLIEESNYKVTSIITVLLLKYSVVNFADFGAFSGLATRLCWPLACGIR